MVYIIIYLILFNIKYDRGQIEKARLDLKIKLGHHIRSGLVLANNICQFTKQSLDKVTF